MFVGLNLEDVALLYYDSGFHLFLLICYLGLDACKLISFLHEFFDLLIYTF